VSLDDQLEADLRAALATWPQLDPTTEAVFARISKIHKLVERVADADLAAAGLTREEFKVLCSLRLATKSHGALCRELGVSTGTMTNRLDKLERGGMVVRMPDPGDRRGVLLKLTADGEQRIDGYVSQAATREVELLSGLGTDERTTLLALLRKLHTAIGHELAR
jgi:DNA-binding MarR family transcriptional regulator